MIPVDVVGGFVVDVAVDVVIADVVVFDVVVVVVVVVGGLGFFLLEELDGATVPEEVVAVGHGAVEPVTVTTVDAVSPAANEATPRVKVVPQARSVTVS